MTSFSLSECLYYAKELKSSVYLCFLDARQAFDRVWHDGLFHKLLSISGVYDSDPVIDTNTFSHFVKSRLNKPRSPSRIDLGTSSDRARNESGRQKFAAVVSYLHKWLDRET
ncbi:hypothetical protein DPMN_011795 [Dreissena polymorpha]|uniref:Reverse transcriptase domain-containing protein n=1 Tax=Dreissena polymorpha TaxID=45954 RepID=A0A9D4S0P0_DREPO|nr:hypothetical protein DPMN_011795 [Dreissena polymorpha]